MGGVIALVVVFAICALCFILCRAAADTNTLSPTMKKYYDTELLENARSELIFAQFGRRQPLPANKGRTVEWRKWNTLPNASALQEGVIPTGEKMGMTTLTASLEQYGMSAGNNRLTPDMVNKEV